MSNVSSEHPFKSAQIRQKKCKVVCHMRCPQRWSHTHGRPHKYRNPATHTNTHTISVPDHRVQQDKPVTQNLTAENNIESIRPSA